MKYIFSLFLALIISLPSFVSAANWVWVVSTEKVGFFYDSQSISFGRTYSGETDTSVAYFWGKYVYTPEAASQVAEQLNAPYVENASYSLYKASFNFRDKTSAMYEEHFYSENGDHLGTYYSDGIGTPIVPDTCGEAVFWAVRAEAISLAMERKRR